MPLTFIGVYGPMKHSHWFGVCYLGFLICCPQLVQAGTVTYDPTLGTLPDQQGWTYSATGAGPSVLSVSGGVLNLTVGLADRGYWDYNLLSAGNTSGTDVSMESTLRILSEDHTSSTRGVSIFELQRTTAGATGTTNEVDGYAWTNGIFWTNSVGAVVGQFLLDTTVDHTYRLELDGDNAYVYVDGSLVGAVLNNTYENGDPNQGDVLRARFGDASAFSGSSTEWVSVTAGALSESISQDDPVLPEPPAPGSGGTTDGVFVFNNVPSGRWFDPPLADGYTFTMISGDLFTAILDFPVGFSMPFTVTAEGHTWWRGPGQSLDFLALLGHGVSSFTVSGITPFVDSANPNAFPLQLAFDAPNASFTMTASVVPEPGSLISVSLALGLVGMYRLRRRGKRSENPAA